MYIFGFIVANIIGVCLFASSFLLLALSGLGCTSKTEKFFMFFGPMMLSMTVFYYTWSDINISITH